MSAPLKSVKGITTSTGAGSAGSLVVTNASGQVDQSFLPVLGVGTQQVGSDTAPANGLGVNSKAVIFPTAFANPPRVFFTITSGLQPGGSVVAYLTTAATTTGFTVWLDVAEFSGGSPNFTLPTDFDWIAFG